MASYSTGTVAKLIGTSRETARLWSIEFSEHLSDGVNVPSGEYRKFNDDDVRVMAFIAKARDNNEEAEKIHADLRSGARADPDQSIQTVTARKTTEYPALRKRIEIIEQQLVLAQQETAKRDAVIEHLEKQLAESKEEVKQLNREIGRLQAGGDG